MHARFRSRPDPSFVARSESIWHLERSTVPGEWSHVGTVAELRCAPGTWYVALPPPARGQRRRFFPDREEAIAYLLWKLRSEGEPRAAPAEEAPEVANCPLVPVLPVEPEPPAPPVPRFLQPAEAGPAALPGPVPLPPPPGWATCLALRARRAWAGLLALLRVGQAPPALR